MTLNLESPKEIRASIRRGELTRSTHGLAPRYVQANLVVLPRKLAFEFLLFCQRDPKPCPVLDVTEVGDPEPKLMAPGADLRTALPRYRVYEYGVPLLISHAPGHVFATDILNEELSSC